MAAKDDKRERMLQFLLGPLVGILVLLFALTKVYERAELVTYDWRFNIRNNLFGPPPIDPRLGTIDIDNQSVTAEGRYQDWTRDKYTDVVRILSEYGARMVGFDVYFIEPSTKLVSEEQVWQLARQDSVALAELFAQVDHDELFRRTTSAAGNVYLAQFIVVNDEELEPEELQAKMEKRTPDEEEALEVIRQRSPRLMVDPDESTLWRGFDFDPPLKLLRDAARGFAYAQTVPDVDGARRRYPLVYQYEDVVFPSIALMMVCDHLEVPLNTVEVRPGDHVKLPRARMSSGKIKDIEIPIDHYGNMNVNWTGKWNETFAHLPHIGLRWAAGRERKQKLFDQIKEAVAADPALARNPRQLPAVLARAGFTDQAANRRAVVTYLQTSGMEQAFQRNAQLTAAEFWRGKVATPQPAQLELFDQIKRTNRVAEMLAADPQATLEDLHAALPDTDPMALRQSAYFVRTHLVDGQVPPGARPLFFYPYIVYEGKILTPASMQDKILFYGLTADGTTDLSVTPFQGSYPMVGIYPNVFNTILQGEFIRRIPNWLNSVLILALSVLISLVVPRLKVLRGAALIAAIVLIYSVIVFFAFTHANVWLEMIGPLLILIIGYLAQTIYGYVIKEREKDFVQGAFGHYLSPAVVDQIMNNPDMVTQLGGEERVMSAFFSDIASFSTISECLTPGELVEFINEYLSEMCDIIEHYGGTIDKFEGDAIVAFFGAPLPYEDHAVRACMACIDQQHKLVELRERWKANKALPVPLQQLRERWEAEGRTFTHVRMGVATGPMIVGNMGSRSRTDYTMMGDTVNLAARFESGQKIYGIGIMINDGNYNQVKDLVETRKLDLIQVVGKEEPVIAYEVLDRKGALTPEKYQVLELYNQGLAAYESFDFATAQKLFEQALEIDPEDGPSALYADRCEEYVESPPTDLVFRAQSK